MESDADRCDTEVIVHVKVLWCVDRRNGGGTWDAPEWLERCDSAKNVGLLCDATNVTVMLLCGYVPPTLSCVTLAA